MNDAERRRITEQTGGDVMVQRWGVSFINEEVFRSDIGSYVLYTDYAALEQRCKELEQEVSYMKQLTAAKIEAEKKWAELEAENAELRKMVNLK